ncbi:MAG: hypothetical protein KF812_11625 [Fimbriimonadaceae bacterium]|nr:hypothetical protein [Fimbriimonadaceae bacterium]
MTRRFLAVLALLAALMAVAPAQTDVRDIRRQAEPFLRKIQILEVYNNLLPILMTPEQVKKILPLIEAARQEERDEAKKELEMMREVEAELDAALKEAKEKGVVPSKEVFAKLQAVDLAVGRLRQMMIQSNVAKVFEALKTILNPGQFRAAAGTFTIPRGPDDPELSQDELVKRWIQYILLEPEAYPILIEMSRGE